MSFPQYTLACPYRKKYIYACIYRHNTYIHAITINDRRNHKLKGEFSEGGKERKKCNYVTILETNKQKKNLLKFWVFFLGEDLSLFFPSKLTLSHEGRNDIYFTDIWLRY